MPRRALSRHRPWLLASLIASISYFLVADAPIGGLWLMLWKGAAVALLAVYAGLRGWGRDRALITLVLALGALGDVALELSFLVGGALFALGHLVAIALYLRNRRAKASVSQSLTAAALLFLTPVIAGMMTYEVEDWLIATAYAALVGAMAAAAWTSRFPRYQVGVGAVLFVISDLLIFAGEVALVPPAVAAWLIWPLYYLGQFLIATGVVQTLRKDRNRARAAV